MSRAEGGQSGVCFPQAGGVRSTTPVARGILGDAARVSDPSLAERIEAAGDWRSDYIPLLRDLTAASGASAEASVGIAEAGLLSAHRRMVFQTPDGAATSLDDVFEGGTGERLREKEDPR